jgi:hypothetical protein
VDSIYIFNITEELSDIMVESGYENEHNVCIATKDPINKIHFFYI